MNEAPARAGFDWRRLRGGELLAAIAGVVLLISLLFLDWYEVKLLAVETPFGGGSITSGPLGAWDREGILGFLANLVILSAGVAAVGLAFLTATSRTVALPVAASGLTTGLGAGAVLMVVARMLFQPFPNELVDLKWGIWLAFMAALGVTYGGWQSMQEEGTVWPPFR
jgi:hypothetical protein